MYFWNVQALKAELQHERLAEQEGFKYILATFGTLSVFSYLTSFIAEPPSLIEQIASLGSMVILFAGTYAAYATNGGARGFDFLGRFMALGWVVGLRVFVVATLVFLGVGIAVALADPVAGESDSFWNPAAAVYVLAMSVISYWRIVTHLRDLRGVPEGVTAYG